MSVEELPPIERVGKNREKLLALEKEGNFVFHGSPNVMYSLEPRQAEGYNKKTGKMEKDGEPMVFATPYADLAIFRALTNFSDDIGESYSEFGRDDETLHFSVTRNILELAKKKVGKVYIFDKRRFSDAEGRMQCFSEETVTPLDVIDVTVDDLPAGIKVRE